MKFSDIPRNPDHRMLRQFAGLWILFFGAIALAQHFRSQQTTLAVIVGTLTLVVGVPGLFFPRILKPIFVGWMILAFPIGWLVSHVILFLIYWSVFVPVGFILRRAGHDPLRLRKPAVDSYWEQKTQQTSLRRYLKQF
jgi:RsiW-degrading membrane proteinase PrsW (M82 family)